MGKNRPYRNRFIPPATQQGVKAAPERTPRTELPPMPERMEPPPLAYCYADDGLASVLIVSVDGPRGWALVDRKGRPVRVVVSLDKELTHDAHIEFGAFEAGRLIVNDPTFLDCKPTSRLDEAAAAPRGPARIADVSYRWDEPLADGNSSVFVDLLSGTIAWLVVDPEGNHVDGERMPDSESDNLALRRFAAFVQRRVDARDPRVRVETRDESSARWEG